MLWLHYRSTNLPKTSFLKNVLSTDKAISLAAVIWAVTQRFFIVTSDCVTVLVTVGKRSETLSKFNVNFFSMGTMFSSFLQIPTSFKTAVGSCRFFIEFIEKKRIAKFSLLIYF